MGVLGGGSLAKARSGKSRRQHRRPEFCHRPGACDRAFLWLFDAIGLGCSSQDSADTLNHTNQIKLFYVN